MLNPDASKFEIEHAIAMHAFSFVTLPASFLYDEKAIAKVQGVASRCHIYFVGFTPKVVTGDLQKEAATVSLTMSAMGQTVQMMFEIPEGLDLIDRDKGIFRKAGSLQELVFNQHNVLYEFSKVVPMDFEVVYIGQAYGKHGKRAAIDRLRKHETLQKIALSGIPEGMELTLLLVEVVPATRTMTVINPRAKSKGGRVKRLMSGIEKLYGTSEAERISLYEASMIRYFNPVFNKVFKNNFPSTNLEVLKDCYAKDFAGVVAEFAFDEMPWRLKSEIVPPAREHVASFHLHGEDERRMLFI